MFGLSTAAIQWLSAGILLVIVGAVIKFWRWTFLLAGYDKTSPVPDDVVADIAGNTIIRIGLAATVLGVLIVVTEISAYLPPLFGVIITLAVVRLIYRIRTYTPSDT
jgi:mannose/fructose/N-acetylgalactosamine-specific phosphotransferase system component IID